MRRVQIQRIRAREDRTVFTRIFGVAVFVAWAGLGCGGSGGPADPSPSDDDPPADPRTYLLGFTDFPHVVTIQGLIEAYRVIADEGDLAVEHFDGGVPWDEALNGTPYSQGFQDELTGKASLVPPGHRVYLAVTPIAFGRNGLALYQRDQPNQPLPAPWSTRSFDHPDVITAFGNHVERMIAIFDPDYVAFAIEANMLLDSVPEEWDAFVALAEAVYTRLTSAHPQLPVFISLQAESFNGDRAGQTPEIQAVLPFSDFIAVSAYPYFDIPTVAGVPSDYFTSMHDLAPAKPFAIAETGWPAEPVGAPAPVSIPATPADQRSYLERVLALAESRNAEFVTWFFTRDFDQAWDETFSTTPDAPVVRLFRDTGLFDGAGSARSALTPWREALLRSHVPN